jgi:hypothetical protein
LQKSVLALPWFWQSLRNSFWSYRLRSKSGQSWVDRGHLVAIRLNCVRIASNLQSRCNRPICEHSLRIVAGLQWSLVGVCRTHSRIQSQFCDIWSNQSTIRFDCVCIA